MIRRPRTRRGPRRGRARWPARLAVVTGFAVMLLAIVAPPAGANYGRVTARVGCDGVVEWTASASTEGGDEDRTNTRVLVEYRAASGGEPQGDWTAAGPEGAFDLGNDFRFTGSFPLPEGADAVDLRVTPLAPWGPGGDGDPPGGPRFSRAEQPAECEVQPIVAAVAEDCGAGGARISARNAGDEAQSVTVAAGGATVRDLEIGAGDSAELVVPLLEGHPTVLRVASGDFVVSESTVRPQCGVTAPAAVVLERCSSRQAVVHATLGDRPSGAAQIRVDGAIVHQVDLTPDVVLQRTLELPAEGSMAVEVAVDGATRALGDVGGCDSPVAGVATCGVDGRPACDPAASAGDVPPPPPPPPPATLDLETDQPMLPRTGPWERAVALFLGGALMLAGGLAVGSRDRRRPVHSALAVAVEPYRQRWWDED